MKVLITTDYYSPAVNGVVTSVSNLKEGLERQGHEVRVLTLSPDIRSHRYGDDYYISSMNVGWLYPNTRFKLLPAHRFVRELIEWHPDVVHSQCEFSTYSYARRIASACHAPLIHTYHTVYEDYTHYFCPSKRLGRFLVAGFTRNILKHTDCVIAPSGKVSSLLNGYHVETPTQVVPTGIDIDRFAAIPSITWLEKKRKEYGLSANTLTLVFIGRLAKEKNITELLDMLKAAPGLPVKLLIVGDGPFRHELMKECSVPGLKDKVVFTGMVAPEEVNFYYHLGDIFVNASTSETQGLTYIEAMAAGLPLLCRKDPCLDGIVINGETGWQYTSQAQFEQAVNSLYHDRDLKRIMSRNAGTAARNYSKSSFATRIADIYRHCMAG